MRNRKFFVYFCTKEDVSIDTKLEGHKSMSSSLGELVSKGRQKVKRKKETRADDNLPHKRKKQIGKKESLRRK